MEVAAQVLPLNQGQQAASNGFFDFLFNDAKELNLSGPGGVGKTFLMGHMIDEIMPRYYEACALINIKPEFDDVVMTATTNKAASVLSESTGRPATTIHSFLNLILKDDYSTGKSTLSRGKSWCVHSRKIIFVDEASMVDSALYAMLMEATHKCKIVYVGDHCQLAPVMEALSPVYKKGFAFYELLEPMRTNDPNLQALNMQMRETVETGVFKPIQVVPGVIDWLNDDEMQAAIDSHFGTQNQESRILAYSNKRVVEYNDYIRGLRQLPTEYTLGEILVNNSAIQVTNGMLSVEQEVTIVDEADYPETVEVEDGVSFQVRTVTLKTRLNELHENIQIPLDRAHFTDLMKYYGQKKNWNRYYFLKNNFPDLRPRDAATVHKAQGSTYKTVFIDMANLSTCHNPDVVARLLYVAVTRAQSRICMYGELANKYGGIVE